MSLVATLSGGPAGWRKPWSPWLPIVVGFTALYLPVYWQAAGTLWQADEHAHAPLVLALAAWIAWCRRAEWSALPFRSSSFAWSALSIGLVLFVGGRALDSSLLLFAAQPIIVAAALLSLKGRAGLRSVWFAVAYLLFAVPLPSWLVDAATGPLKQWISVIAETVLHTLGYPIARSGVIISIGQYEMLVADACSGLHSMVALAALGTLFMYLKHRHGGLHNALMLLGILPIAFAANVMRVMLLVLVTYHFGDAAGQGFLHGFAGFLLMLTALCVFFALDIVLISILPPRRSANRPS